ncbi:hypothetical protein SCHPADRAFT_909987 [Schizopora paradoxa]|uniref:Uncharacterized protein n=1 Tax=Schizopora paradoxa TaxID=27342 RepID=A0A0H2R6F3_9AGAM|nr:hypothetical protein SCHPADRAFT_911552 [Schizopora paradoxa]KLO06897.1 hypothetical protein SCHPADRAFT_909987 [Schizopora paradoxa]
MPRRVRRRYSAASTARRAIAVALPRRLQPPTSYPALPLVAPARRLAVGLCPAPK